MSDRTERYLYRCPRESLMTSLKHIEESGDSVEWPIFMGEQGFWLICRKAVDRNARLQDEVAEAVDAGRFAPGGDLA